MAPGKPLPLYQSKQPRNHADCAECTVIMDWGIAGKAITVIPAGRVAGREKAGVVIDVVSKTCTLAH